MFCKTTIRTLVLIIGLLSVIATAAMGFGSAVETYGWAFNQGYNPVHLEHCPMIAGTALLLATFAFTLFNSRRMQ
ncbi:hypothetical protein [Serratia quinivorans]|uniref:hypothetical protein n=1 Tax=Serratia quinivorans TaxID=137545 RepID=UPI00217C1CBA|nr:hypothetical protein [Serratia quinivorans]CAI0884592.1 Uncharacterised protein [Serratia quinivorans]